MVGFHPYLFIVTRVSIDCNAMTSLYSQRFRRLGSFRASRAQSSGSTRILVDRRSLVCCCRDSGAAALASLAPTVCALSVAYGTGWCSSVSLSDNTSCDKQLCTRLDRRKQLEYITAFSLHYFVAC